jgi:hypothetical protein
LAIIIGGLSSGSSMAPPWTSLSCCKIQTAVRAHLDGRRVVACAEQQEVIVARRKSPFPSLSSDQAHAALRWLHALGKITSKEIAGALRERDRLASGVASRNSTARARDS